MTLRLRGLLGGGGRRARRATVLLALASVSLTVAAGQAAPEVDLVDPDVRLSDGFYPCPGQTDFTRAPLVAECLAGGVALQPLVVEPGTTSCNAAGSSTVRVAPRAHGAAFVPGGGWLSGDVTWELTATIGPQTGPAMPNVQPFPDDGMRMESVGFATGTLTALSGRFTIDRSPSGAGPEDISGEVELTPNGGNWGVCRTFLEQPTGSPVFGPAPLTGAFYIVNAGVLTYSVTAGPAGLAGETGIAEAYFSNTFATCCDADDPTAVNSAAGHLKLQFGTIHAAEGTSGSAPTPTGENVEVTSFAGLGEDVGGVSVTFGAVASAGETTVTLMTSAPAVPSGFTVGDPPAFYEIATSAAVAPPITVCLPFGSLPAGTEPRLLHYEDGAWVDRTTSVSGPPDNVVCGVVDSLSPFAAVYAPLSAAGKIGDAIAQLEALTTARNRDKLEDVVQKLEQALAKLARTPADVQGAAGELEGAVGDLESAVSSSLLSSTSGNPVLTGLAESARLLAVDAIAAAEARNGSSKKISEARAELSRGDSRLAAGRFKDAVAGYKDAVSKAEGA